eukprot:CAMPEP_0168475220 /NCGR_PEP_ID=MMETSP0228-20121227/61248_1 /TAXON_ID=133427 /ORGANISM="Protoceratium reticulatum, Strain CCCM 535 (=CCMP 1889)" /LENGTH=37 /DNA_ID= /DNA_START= /DNA_END= /DNA_ORIENTATION=
MVVAEDPEDFLVGVRPPWVREARRQRAHGPRGRARTG